MKQDQIGILIKRASLEVEKTTLAILAPYSMNLTQYKIIVYLYNAPPASTRQVDLERAFSMTNPSVTSVLHTLEKKGLIRREENPEDKRSNVISLTDKAIRMQSELEAVGKQLEETITKNLSPEERAALIVLLKKCFIKNETEVGSMTLTELPSNVRPQGKSLDKLRERVYWLENNDAERFQGVEPVDVVSLYRELLENYETAYPRYYEKRIRLKGIVSKIGPDEFGAPSFQFTDEAGTRCYTLIVFPTEDIYGQVQESSWVEIIGNVVFIREPYGLVVKKCELLGSAEV